MKKLLLSAILLAPCAVAQAITIQVPNVQDIKDAAAAAAAAANITAGFDQIQKAVGITEAKKAASTLIQNVCMQVATPIAKAINTASATTLIDLETMQQAQAAAAAVAEAAASQ